MKIPENLKECYLELDNIIDKTEDGKEYLQMFLQLNEEKAIVNAHHNLGQWIRNNWELWTGDSNLCKWFNSNQIQHPDDMSSIILTSYHRYKHNKEIKLEEQLEHYIMYWLDDKEKEKRIRKNKLNEIKNIT